MAVLIINFFCNILANASPEISVSSSRFKIFLVISLSVLSAAETMVHGFVACFVAEVPSVFIQHSAFLCAVAVVQHWRNHFRFRGRSLISVHWLMLPYGSC